MLPLFYHFNAVSEIAEHSLPLFLPTPDTAAGITKNLRFFSSALLLTDSRRSGKDLSTFLPIVGLAVQFTCEL